MPQDLNSLTDLLKEFEEKGAAFVGFSEEEWRGAKKITRLFQEKLKGLSKITNQ